MTIETTRFDIQNHLKTREEQISYLEAVLEDGDSELIAAAIGDIARAHGATQFAKETGLSRETIYKDLAVIRHLILSQRPSIHSD
jgi:probable addiction module antidote protein